MQFNGRARHRTKELQELAAQRDRLVVAARTMVREHPAVTIAAAGVVGGVLGGVLFSRFAKLLFVAAVGYVANELWHREGRLDIDKLVERLSSRRSADTLDKPDKPGTQ